MVNETIILHEFPEIDVFYQTYWGRKPFIVRQAIGHEIFDQLIDGDGLAGLSLEEDVTSRLVVTEHDGNKWTCHHGPFEEARFAEIGDENWSLLVQNVEQHHPETAQLLKAFYFSPRWLMDDIMVSYSAVGGSVGPHMDSYHVFLVQGKGRRKWKIGHAPLTESVYADNADLLILKDGFEGAETEVSMGDVIYIPPQFGHQGITTQEAMTFSVGFLGPKMSEMLAEYSYYLEQHPELDARYIGQGLDAQSAAFSISPSAINRVQNGMIEAVKGGGFATWLTEYFATSAQEEFYNEGARDGDISGGELLEKLQYGAVIFRPEHVKIATTMLADGSSRIAVFGESVVIPAAYERLIGWLNDKHEISIDDLQDAELVALVTDLYHKGVFAFGET